MNSIDALTIFDKFFPLIKEGRNTEEINCGSYMVQIIYFFEIEGFYFNPKYFSSDGIGKVKRIIYFDIFDICAYDEYGDIEVYNVDELECAIKKELRLSN